MSATLSRRAFLGRRIQDSEVSGSRVAALSGRCLATAGVACGVCADPCEPRALRIKPQLGGRALPVIDAAACTGCGECVLLCPVASLSLVPAEETAPCA